MQVLLVFNLGSSSVTFDACVTLTEVTMNTQQTLEHDVLEILTLDLQTFL